MKKLLTIAALIAMPSTALASSDNGRITNVYTMDNGVVLFEIASQSPRQGAVPSCASGNLKRWALNGTTPAGQVKVANLLTAFSLRNLVYVFGKGSCVSWGDTEEVDFINNVQP